jgi:hypothetical protein
LKLFNIGVTLQVVWRALCALNFVLQQRNQYEHAKSMFSESAQEYRKLPQHDAEKLARTLAALACTYLHLAQPAQVTP